MDTYLPLLITSSLWYQNFDAALSKVQKFLFIIGKLYSEEELAIRCSRAGSGSHLIGETGNLEPASSACPANQIAQNFGRTKQSKSQTISDEYKRMDSIYQWCAQLFRPDLRFVGKLYSEYLLKKPALLYKTTRCPTAASPPSNTPSWPWSRRRLRSRYWHLFLQ